jgi:hypothetical protein
MERYIGECITDFEEEEPEEKSKQVATAATDNFFKTQTGEEEKLSRRRASKEPDLDEWKKFFPVLVYLKSMLMYHLTSTCKELDILMHYIINESFATHVCILGQSRAALVMGRWVVLSISNKQKMNMRSSTEAEMIAVDDALPMIQFKDYN